MVWELMALWRQYEQAKKEGRREDAEAFRRRYEEAAAQHRQPEDKTESLERCLEIRENGETASRPFSPVALTLFARFFTFQKATRLVPKKQLLDELYKHYDPMEADRVNTLIFEAKLDAGRKMRVQDPHRKTE